MLVQEMGEEPWYNPCVLGLQSTREADLDTRLAKCIQRGKGVG